MTDLSRDPLLMQCYELLGAIERCGASPELTEAVTLGTKLMLTIAARLQPRRLADRGPDLYSHARTESSHYELLGPAIGAGTDRGHDTVVYRDLVTGQLFTRLPEDFTQRMTKSAAGLPLKPNDDMGELLEWRALFNATLNQNPFKPTSEQGLWPNPWCQEVAMVAFLIHTLRQRLALMEKSTEDRATADLVDRHRILDWNRSQNIPPITLGREYEVAEALMQLIRGDSPDE